MNLPICRLCCPGCPPNKIVRIRKDKYQDLASELKKLWNMKTTVIPIVIVALGTVTKGLIRRLGDLVIRGRVKTIQILLKSARIQRKVLETWGDLLLLKLLRLTPVWKTRAEVNNNQKYVRQLNNKWTLCGESNEMTFHILCECSELALKDYMIRHDKKEKVVHWELCKNISFDHTN